MPDPRNSSDGPRPAVLVSACLLGRRCRYDGSSNAAPEIDALTRGMRVIPVCPEEMGGLGTPRPAAELSGGSARDVLEGRARVLTHAGTDVTAQFLAGAVAAAEQARQSGAQLAILKERSPSCGVGCVHQDGRQVSGRGVTAERLAAMGVCLVALDPPKQR